MKANAPCRKARQGEKHKAHSWKGVRNDWWCDGKPLHKVEVRESALGETVMFNGNQPIVRFRLSGGDVIEVVHEGTSLNVRNTHETSRGGLSVHPEASNVIRIEPHS